MSQKNREQWNEHPDKAEWVDLCGDMEGTKDLNEGSLEALHEKENNVMQT